MDTRGITIRVWSKALKGFDRRINALGLRRDTFLSRVLEREVKALEAEITERVASDVSLDLRKELKRLDTTLVTLRLPSDLVVEIDRVCEEKNIARDAFFNRVIFALCVKPAVFMLSSGVFDFPVLEVMKEGYETHGQEFIDGPLDAAQGILNDPFWVIRASLEVLARENVPADSWTFYTVRLRNESIKGFGGLNLIKSDEGKFDDELEELLGMVAMPDVDLRRQKK